MKMTANSTKLIEWLKNNPDSAVSDMTGIFPERSYYSISSMLSKLKKEGLVDNSNYGKWRVTDNLPVTAVETPENARETPAGDNISERPAPVAKPLSSYTPRELLAELKSRGYVWERMYVKQFIEYSKI